MSEYIASVQSYNFDLRFQKNSASVQSFDTDLTQLLKRYSIKALKKSRQDVTEEYAEETIMETCKNCGKKVQVYLMKPSFCMSCGHKIYPCSLCESCTNCKGE